MPEPDIIDGGEADDEREPPVEGEDGSPPQQEALHRDSEPHDEQRETPKHIDPQTLVRQAENVLATMDKIVRDLADEDLEELRALVGKNEQGQEWIADLEESRQFCEDHRGYIEHLKQQAEHFVQWNAGSLTPRAVVETNALTRRAILDRAELTEEEKEERRRTIDAQHANINAYLDDPERRTIVDARWQELAPGNPKKTSIVQHVEEQTHLHGRWGEEDTWEPGTLEEMQTTLASYEEILDEFRQSFRRKREALEAGEKVETQQETGGGGWGDFNFKLIHLVHFGMAIKKIYNIYKHQWEHDMEKAASELSLFIGKPWMGQQPYQKLVDEVEAYIRKEANEAESSFDGLPFSDFYDGTFRKEPTEARNLAKLKIAARRGFLYGLDEESATLTIYGTPLKNLVPSHWNTQMIREYYANLQRAQRGAEREETEKGVLEAKGYVQDGFAVTKLEEAIRDGLYYKATGIAQWIMLRRVGTGEGGATILETIRRLIVDDAQFGKLATFEILKNFGGIAEQGIPEISLHELKEHMVALKAIGKKGTPKERIRAIVELSPTLHAAAELRRRLTGPDGKPLVDMEEVYDAKDIAAFQDAKTKPTNNQIISKAIGNILAGNLVKLRAPTTDGKQWIWAYDPGEALLKKHRENIAVKPQKINYTVSLDQYDMGHFANAGDSEAKMLSSETIAELFTYTSTTDEIVANRGGGRLTAYLVSIAKSYNRVEKRVKKEGAPQTAFDAFREDIKERLTPGIEQLIFQARRGERYRHHLAVLRTEIRTELSKTPTPIPPQWLEDLLHERNHPSPS